MKVDIIQKSGGMDYEEALRFGSVNLENTRLNLARCSLLYDPQIFTGTLKPVLYSVPAFESVKVQIKVVEYETSCEFKAMLQL